MTARTYRLLKMIGRVATPLAWIGAAWMSSYILAYQSTDEFFWSVVNQYFFRFSLPAVGLLLALSKGTFLLMPKYDRDIPANDALVAGLATSSVLFFVSAKWLGPILDSFSPFYPVMTQGKGSKILTVISALLLALAAPRFVNARISRIDARSTGWTDKETTAILVMFWVFTCVGWALLVRDVYGDKLPILRTLAYSTVDITEQVFIAPVVLFLLGAAFMFYSRDQSMRSIGRVSEGNRNGYQLLTWSQIVGTSETVAGKDGRRRFRIYGGVIVVAALAGVANGSAEDAAFYATVAAWLGALGLRGAGKFAMQGQTLVHVPHTKTDEERREELTPVTRREDCEAFVEEVDGTLWFCVARGTVSEGPLPVVERVPFDSFGNFEEGSHKQWFRPRGTVSETLDWGVIVAQSSVGRIVLVAQSVDEQAWLIELLVKLQTTFIAPRDAMLRALTEAEHKRRAHDEPTGSSGAPIDATPVKPF